MVVSCTPAGVSSGVWGVRVDLGVMLLILLRGRFRWPFALAGLAMRYLRTMCASRWGAPLRKPTLMALSNEAMGRLQKLWCANFTLLILVVRAYENPADSIHYWVALGMIQTGVKTVVESFCLCCIFVHNLIATLGWSLQPRRVLLVVSLGWWLGL